MSMTQSSVSRAPRPSSLADVLDLILDKGLVIDAYVRVSLAGIELLTVDARVVVASVDTYLRFAEAVNRLDLSTTEQAGLPALFGADRRGDGSSNGSDDRSATRQTGRSRRAGSERHDRDDRRAGAQRQEGLSRRGGGTGARQASDDDGGLIE